MSGVWLALVSSSSSALLTILTFTNGWISMVAGAGGSGADGAMSNYHPMPASPGTGLDG